MMRLGILLMVGCGTEPPNGVTSWETDLGPSADWAGLVINEFMARNASTVTDSTGAYPDWIELFNPTDTDVDITGWTLSDDIGERDKHTLGALTLAAGGWLLLFADDDEEQGVAHLGFNLSGEGEEIGLYAPDGSVVDELEYGEMPVDESAARVVDGGDDWEITDTPTPGTSNEGGP